MKIVEINMMNYGSTGKIMLQIADCAREQGHDVWVAYPDSRDSMKKHVENSILIGNRFTRVFHINFARITGYNGCLSISSTVNLIRKLKKINPDVIHLHNLHNCYINLPMLFNFIKKNNIRTIWTLHDCWSFTGQCPHFTIAKCDKWKTGCHNCNTYREYPSSYVDRTKTMWNLKKKWFTGVKNMTIVTPSKWLGNLVKESYFKDYPVKVINNGIDLSVFKPTESDFKNRYNCQDKFIILGVANAWDYKKGLDVFIELSKRLDNNKYQIVLVGTDDTVDKQLPENIISVHRTQNQAELAEIYTVAGVLINPTREDTFPTVNIEALACGTPVFTFNVGGSPEILDKTCGMVFDVDDVDSLEREIDHIASEKIFDDALCVARAQKYNCSERFCDYVDLY